MTATVVIMEQAYDRIRRTLDGASSNVRCLRTNENDRLALGPPGRIEGGDGVVEGGDGADVRPQPPVADALDNLIQVGPVGLDDEVDGQPVGRPRLGGPDDGHQRSARPDQTRGSLLDVSADDVEDQVDTAGV